MDTLSVIRHITQTPKYTNIVIDSKNLTPMEAICYMASIDISHYGDFGWKLTANLEKTTLSIFNIQITL